MNNVICSETVHSQSLPANGVLGENPTFDEYNYHNIFMNIYGDVLLIYTPALFVCAIRQSSMGEGENMMQLILIVSK